MPGDIDVRVLDLFSGIGGMSLGLERAGMETVAFCEIDAWCRSRLRQNWPGLPVYRDVKHVRAASTATLGRVDLIAGGFPCQDISTANPKGKGIDGERSGLAFEMLRIIGELRPDWCLFENSPNLRARGYDRLLVLMEEQGYSCWPLVVGARHVLAPHRRDRVWIIAHARNAITERRRSMGRRIGKPEGNEGGGRNAPHAHGHGQSIVPVHGQMGGSESASDANGEPWGWWNGGPGAHLSMGYGISARLARRHLSAYGNSVVPQVVECIGRAIMTVDAQRGSRK